MVGIGFPVPIDDVQPYRKQNYVPPGWNDEEGIGGAENFLRFIRKDLIPLIEAEYRVNSTDRMLFGSSRGGLFALYAPVQRSPTFNRYIIGSPWFTQDDTEEVFRSEDDYAACHSDLAAKVFMAAGFLEPEPVVRNVRQLGKILRSRNYSSLRLTTHIFEGETHMSVTPYTLCKGMKVVYE